MRGGDLYLSWPVRHCLLILAKSTKGKEVSDAIAERVLTDWLKKEHPSVWAFVDEQQKREDVVIEGLAAAQPKPSTKAKAKKAEPQPEIEDNFGPGVM